MQLPATVRSVLFLSLSSVAAAPRAMAQETPPAAPAFADAAASVQRQLAESVAELDTLRAQIAGEQIPLSRELRDLEASLVQQRSAYQDVAKVLDGRTLDLANLRTEIQARQGESSYLSNLLGEYINNFESRLHIAELQRYANEMKAAKLAPENSNLSAEQVYAAQAGLLELSLDRLEEALGGSRFEGTAVDPGGVVKRGTFVLLGPAALFASDDGKEVGTAEQRLGSLEASVLPFTKPEDLQAASRVVGTSSGRFPLDPSGGNAHKIAATQESLIEHIKLGGPVMVPIFVVGFAALFVVLAKWLSMAFLRKPSASRMSALLAAVARRDQPGAKLEAQAVGGPSGAMLAVGVAHLDQPRELIEEVMYEQVLATKLKLQRFLPFVALSASAAPLLGLLGTVTGIMNTFKLITVFGTGDVKTLSSGISEALITTEYGLIVAIPSLLLHALLTRKARGIVDDMERSAIALMNEYGKSASSNVGTAA